MDRPTSEDVEFELKSISNQVEYLFFKLDDIARRIEELEERIKVLEWRIRG